MQQPMKTCFWAEVQACSPDLLQDALCLLLPIAKTFPSNIPLSFFFGLTLTVTTSFSGWHYIVFAVWSVTFSARL